jgi:hypothetical protein
MTRLEVKQSPEQAKLGEEIAIELFNLIDGKLGVPHIVF